MIHIEQMGRTGLVIRSRDKEGNLKVEQVTDFRPYFYDNNKCKVFVETPADVPQVKKNYEKTYEADIPYTQRYLIDRVSVPIPKEPLRVCCFDIEVSNKCLDSENAPEPIIIISCYDNFLKKHISFVWRKDLEEKVEKSDERSNYYFNNEEKMLLTFVKFIRETNPDIMTGWNCDVYDLPYIINRCRRLRLSFIKELSPFDYVAVKQEQKRGFKSSQITVKGRVILDLYKGYRGLDLAELPSYSLEYIAEKELGIKKVQPDLMKMWEDIPELIRYCSDDVKLVKMIDEKRMIIDYYDALRRATGSIWGFTRWMGQMIDVCLLREAQKRGEVLPTKPDREERERLAIALGKKVGGGFVKSTSPGVHTGVFVMDLKSTYPSIIQQFNISYETICEGKKGDIKLGNGVSFDSSKQGLYSAILENLIATRIEFQKEMKKYEYGSYEYNAYFSVQFALKFLINALYGANNDENFRFFNPKLADSITWCGRELINYSEKIIGKEGHKVIYADTDSLFVETKLTNTQEILKIQEVLVNKLNESFDTFVQQFGSPKNNFIKMAFEKIFSEIIFTKAKKRYAGNLVWVDDKPAKELYIKGFEKKRSDFNIVGKEIQVTVFEMILAKKNKVEVDTYIKKKREEIMKIKDLDLVAIPRGIKKDFNLYRVTNPYIRGAQYANKYLGEQIRGGDKIKFLYVKEVIGKPPTKEVCYIRNPPEVIIDWNKMFKRTVKNNIDRIYDAMGWDEFSDQEGMQRWFK
jgi:DNA polymerase elongation subunit (family B)